jgi:hypothetical protein
MFLYAESCFEQLCAQWPTNARPDCLVTCGAFLRFAWPDQLLPRSFFAPEPETVERLRIPGEVARESAMMSPTIPI